MGFGQCKQLMKTLEFHIVVAMAKGKPDRTSWLKKVVHYRVHLLILGLLTLVYLYRINQATLWNPTLPPEAQQDDHHRAPLINPHDFDDSQDYNDAVSHDFAHEYMKDDGCDFSAFVQAFEPSALPLDCHHLQDELSFGKPIGAGFFRQVFRGHLRKRPVAIKAVHKDLIKTKGHQRLVRKQLEEAAVMNQLSGESHIVQLMGVCGLTLVSELASESLKDRVIKKNHSRISVLQALEYALDMAKGLSQLHGVNGGPIIHRDLKLDQFLFIPGENDKSPMTLKLNDFNRMKYAGPVLVSPLDNQSEEYTYHAKDPRAYCTYNSHAFGGKGRCFERMNINWWEFIKPCNQNEFFIGIFRKFRYS